MLRIWKQAHIGRESEDTQYRFRIRMDLSTTVSHVRRIENTITSESPLAMQSNASGGTSILLENASIAPGTACTGGSLAAEKIVSTPVGKWLTTGIALAL
jgi:hypothetical protein